MRSAKSGGMELPTLSEDQLEELRPLGFEFCHSRYFCSDHAKVNLEYLVWILGSVHRDIDIHTAFYAVEFPELKEFPQLVPRIAFFPEQALAFDVQIKRLHGKYVQLCCLYNGEFKKLYGDIVNQCAGAFQFFVGMNFARECHFVMDHRITDNSFGPTSTNSVIPYGETSGFQSDWMESVKLGGFGITGKPRTFELIQRANESISDDQRFMLLWTALESQIGTGEARKRFFEKTLGSEEVSKEIYRIFKMRNLCFKEGAPIKLCMFDEYLLKSAIRLGCLGAGSARERLVSLLERAIQETDRPESPV